MPFALDMRIFVLVVEQLSVEDGQIGYFGPSMDCKV